MPAVSESVKALFESVAAQAREAGVFGEVVVGDLVQCTAQESAEPAWYGRKTTIAPALSGSERIVRHTLGPSIPVIRTSSTTTSGRNAASWRPASKESTADVTSYALERDVR